MEARSPEEAFEQFLENNPHSLRSEFERFRDRYPHWARDLERLWVGLQAFHRASDSVRLGFDSVPSSLRVGSEPEPRASDRRPPRPRILVYAPILAAAALVALGVTLFLQDEAEGDPRMRAEQERARVLLRMRPAIAALSNPDNPYSRLYTDLLVEGEQSLAELRDGASASDGALLDELRRTYADLRESLEGQLRPGFDGDDSHRQHFAYFVGPVAVAASAFQQPVAAHFFRIAQESAYVSFTVVDLDTGEVDPPGVRLWGRFVDMRDGQLERAKELSYVRGGVTTMPFGEVRIVALRDGVQYGEQRLILLPGEVHAATLFVRSSALQPDELVRLDAAPTPYGCNEPGVDMHYLERSIDVPNFLLDRREVSVAFYEAFRTDVKRHREAWFPHGPCPVDIDEASSDDPRCAASGISWNVAALFCNWAGTRLPTDMEWERAAQGSAMENRLYPWGQEWDPEAVALSNLRFVPSEQNPDDLVPQFDGKLGAVDAGSPAGRTPEGIERLADNVSEWTADHFTYPMDGEEGLLDHIQDLLKLTPDARAIRGSSFMGASEHDCRCDWRAGRVRNTAMKDTGIRRASTPPARLRQLWYE